MKVLYFAELKELLQMESETINLSYDITCLLYTSPSPRD